MMQSAYISRLPGNQDCFVVKRKIIGRVNEFIRMISSDDGRIMTNKIGKRSDSKPTNL